MQIPISLAVPWNFDKDDIHSALKWLMHQRTQYHPDHGPILSALEIVTDVAIEYATNAELETDDEFMILLKEAKEVQGIED